ncbi:hypothetical protein [Flavobacterium limi]|uniref:Ribosomal protein L7/L12 C-terminal domain-containing protein n=1 Tax=Flavobacterium limi TaxID=2045105 RepID=A0ABQ1UX52_9FLAO|nr:hypothetical protein [Flavobacterium limi]GGF27339.1 hypothetical protein GCM10011518_40870 [Flavobacterium limi]
MAKIVMESWREGLKGVSLVKLQNEILGLGLKEAKTNLDNLLDDIQIILEIADENSAKYFLEEADKLGVNCKFIK